MTVAKKTVEMMEQVLVEDGHGARRAGADDPPGCHQGSVADPDREDEG